MSEDMMGTLKGLLGDNADEKIQSVLSMLGNTEPSHESQERKKTEDISNRANSPSLTPEMFQYISQLKGMIDDMGRANDSRSMLLLALKPYMRQTRQRGIDNAIRLLNISKMTGLFK